MAWVVSLKVFFISIGVLFTALGLRVSVPLFLEFAATHVPAVWKFCHLCFKPPYLFVLINGIIICIAASSRYHHSVPGDDDLTTEEERPAPPSKSPVVVPANYEMKSPPVVRRNFAILEPPVVYEPREELAVVEVKAVVVNGSVAVEDEDENENEKGIESIVDEDTDMESTWTSLKRMDSSEIPLDYPSPPEKPLVSARFVHRKPPRSSPEGGRSLKVARPKRHETLENTWKAITEGRAMPLSRHMKKCDTWENRGSAGPHEVKKSETFKDRSKQSASTSSPMKLRKEPSLSQDELNRRVEAFIRKFNEEMRLQRQESLNQLMEMINRGTQ